MEGNPTSRQIGRHVRSLLKRRKISGSELARRIHTSQTYVSRRLNGSQDLTVSDLTAFATVLDVPVTRIVADAVGERVGS